MPRATAVGLDQPGPGWHVLSSAAREIVQDGHLVAGGDIRVSDVGADEPSTARDQDRTPHTSRLGLQV